MLQTLAASQFCPVNSSSFCLTHFQLRSPLLNSFPAIVSFSQFSQLFATALKIVPSLPTSAHLSLTPFTSSLLFSTLLNDSHLWPPLQFFPPPLNSSHLFRR